MDTGLCNIIFVALCNSVRDDEAICLIKGNHSIVETSNKKPLTSVSPHPMIMTGVLDSICSVGYASATGCTSGLK